MLLAAENKIKQYISAVGQDPQLKDQGIPESVDQFLAAASTFREMKRSNRVPPSAITIPSKSSSSSSSKKEVPDKKARIAILFLVAFLPF